jgi:hypothetical protein
MGMQNRSPSNQRPVLFRIGATEFGTVFRQYLSPRRLSAKLRCRNGRKQRSDVKISDCNLIYGRVYHCMQAAGTAATHVAGMCTHSLSESQVSRRCRSIGMAIFEWILGEILGARADRKREPEAFYQGLRLVGIDGTLFSMFNTPSVLKQMSKAVSRRMKAAFAQLGVVALVELGTHRPMAASIARPGESEMAMARRLIHQLPGGCLLLADRLYGVGKFLVAFLKLFAQGDNDFLVRVKRGKFKSRRLRRCRDGSALLQVWGADPDGSGRVEFEVREIRGVVIGRGAKRTTLRLWSSLLDEDRFPARQLLELYVERWEIEISFKELKIHLHGGVPLRSYTPETGRQEIASLLICQALLADLRLEAARRGDIPVLRVSFMKVLHHVAALWEVLSWGGGSLSDLQKQSMVRGMYKSLRRQISGPRRNRSCVRALRQTVTSWPRKLRNGLESHGSFRYEVSHQFNK